MNDAVEARLRSLGVEDRQIMIEHYLPPSRQNAPPPFDGAVVRAEGSGEEAVVPAGETILAALARCGAAVVYACQSGVCGTCRAELIAGEVDEGFPFVLTDDERRAGIILTCVARPLSPEVVVRPI